MKSLEDRDRLAADCLNFAAELAGSQEQRKKGAAR
jgi:hypothetical protein